MKIISRFLVKTSLAWGIFLQCNKPSFSSTAGSSNFQGIDGRWSFSLTTFEANGILKQVGFASRAASLGPTLIAIQLPASELGYPKENEVLFLTCQKAPTCFVNDDGTSRIVQVHKEIVVAHTGIAADGRKVVADAIRAAVEHKYIFDEDVPLEKFLEDLSMLFQKYTMKPGARPFGCSILVSYIPQYASRDSDGAGPQFFRIDPSGLVQNVSESIIVLGSQAEAVTALLSEEHRNNKIKNAQDAVKVVSKLMMPPQTSSSEDSTWNNANCRFLIGKFSASLGLQVTPA